MQYIHQLQDLNAFLKVGTKFVLIVLFLRISHTLKFKLYCRKQKGKRSHIYPAQTYIYELRDRRNILPVSWEATSGLGRYFFGAGISL